LPRLNRQAKNQRLNQRGCDARAPFLFRQENFQELVEAYQPNVPVTQQYFSLIIN